MNDQDLGMTEVEHPAAEAAPVVEAAPLEHIAPDYLRDSPEHGAASPQAIYRFDNGQGVTVTHHLGQWIMTPVRFIGAEITAFESQAVRIYHGTMEAVQHALHSIKNS